VGVEDPIEREITVNGRRALAAPAGASVFEALAAHGIFLPTACGGRGACGLCKVRIPEGAGPLSPAERSLLSGEERAAGVRLGCQVRVAGDLAVEIPEELLAVRSFRGRVERIRDLTHDIKGLRIRLLDPRHIDFVAGQYVRLVAPACEGSPEPVSRAYSLSNPPSQRDIIELIIRRVPGGIATTWLFTVLKAGDEVAFHGPCGEFHLTDSDAEMVWIAGGSGMAPFRSIARDMAEKNIRRKCTYFFGALTRRDLFLVDELRRIERQLPGFTFVPAVSQPEGWSEWRGERGLVTEVAARHLPDGTSAEAYLCGSGGMIRAAIRALAAKGIPEERIFYDAFR